jgi:hypothetical protein
MHPRTAVRLRPPKMITFSGIQENLITFIARPPERHDRPRTATRTANMRFV